MKNFILVAVASIILMCCTTAQKRMYGQGEVMVDKIEKFVYENGRVPRSLTEVGIEEKAEGPLHYEILDSLSYIVWFESSMGETILYDSRDGKWENMH